MPAAGNPSESVAAPTPGSACSRGSNCSKKRMLAAESGYLSRGRSMRAVRMFSIPNGICTFFSWTTLLIIRPAAMSKPHDTASSAITRPLLNLPRPALVDDRLSSLSAVPGVTRAACSAGSPPATRLARTINPATKSITR